MGYDFTEIYQINKQFDVDVHQIVSRIEGFGSFSSISEYELENLPKYAAVIAKAMKEKKKPVTPTQLRRFYTYVKSIDLANKQTKEDEQNFKDKYKLKFILPKIAGSSECESLEDLYKVLNACVNGDKIITVKDLRLFMEFFEAILDYHSTFKTQKKDN
ncbi:type III-A CRISPR-associated protein Csm2 [Chlorobium phaeobacteroides]|uniref:CRISPR system Cms protein Csm2 n=1 Tax=Chlorobium phaeobacteroides (strain DSM 266 / SMG 266 / 2430) TaxID=290317 RepID=A1BI34_CHLPD|nr:type III-A CRISPR-associated protein Csm2 [Chlorobium phaeobacteroides]ABL66061.1 CRISPR-associated protein, Csm2 family [Chlorobium phaeobacteroides DSM 266]